MEWLISNVFAEDNEEYRLTNAPFRPADKRYRLIMLCWR